MLSGFKQFILRGSVVDLAVGVVIGAAFGTSQTRATAGWRYAGGSRRGAVRVRQDASRRDQRAGQTRPGQSQRVVTAGRDPGAIWSGRR